MKILYINEFLNSSSGAAVHGRKICNELECSGSTVISIPAICDGDQIRSINQSYTAVKSRLPVFINESLVLVKKVLRLFIWAFRAICIIGIKKPDCVLIRPGLYDPLPIFLKNITKVPIILEVNAPLCLERVVFNKMRGITDSINPIFQRIEVETWKCANAIYTVSDQLKRIIQKELGDLAPKIEVIPNGVDAKLFSNIVGKCQIAHGEFIGIYFVGSFHPWHGVDILIDAFKSVAVARSSVKLFIVGDGYNRKELEDSVFNDSCFGDKIVFTGLLPHNEVLRMLSMADILVAPYNYPGTFYFSPIKIFEYMVSGKAIVASGVGQISEILANGVDSILVPPGDKDALSAALLRLIDSKDLREKLGKAALWKAQKYTWQNSAKALLDFLGKVITKK